MSGLQYHGLYVFICITVDILLPPLHRWATEAQGKTGWDLVSDKTPTSKCLKYRCLPTQWVSTLSLQPVEINRVWRATELDKCRCLLWDASRPDFPVTDHLFLRENTAKSLKCWAMGTWPPRCSLWASIRTAELPHADSPPGWPPLFGVISKRAPRDNLLEVRHDVSATQSSSFIRGTVLLTTWMSFTAKTANVQVVWLFTVFLKALVLSMQRGNTWRMGQR